MDIKVAAMVAILAIVFISGEVNGRPHDEGEGWNEFYNRFGDEHRRSLNQCEEDIEVRELCQLCAVRTKSKLAYPMCCKGVQNTASWCARYMGHSHVSNSNSV